MVVNTCAGGVFPISHLRSTFTEVNKHIWAQCSLDCGSRSDGSGSDGAVCVLHTYVCRRVYVYICACIYTVLVTIYILR